MDWSWAASCRNRGQRCPRFPKRRAPRPKLMRLRRRLDEKPTSERPSAPSPPSWMGEVAAFAQVLTHVGLLKAIQKHVQFARARFGTYDTIDFVVVLLGYALSGEG